MSTESGFSNLWCPHVLKGMKGTYLWFFFFFHSFLLRGYLLRGRINKWRNNIWTEWKYLGSDQPDINPAVFLSLLTSVILSCWNSNCYHSLQLLVSFLPSLAWCNSLSVVKGFSTKNDYLKLQYNAYESIIWIFSRFFFKQMLWVYFITQ